MRTPALLIALIALISLITIRYHSHALSTLQTSPLASAQRMAPTPLVGRAIEVIEAGSYTYMAVVEGDAAPVWVVVMGRGSVEGQEVQLTRWASYQRFTSPRLNKTFSPLYLSTMR